MILGDARNKNIGPAIVIEIAYRDAHVVTIAGESRLLRDVSEGSIVIVVVETVIVFWRIFLEGWNCGAIDEENVQVTVVVVIE